MSLSQRLDDDVTRAEVAADAVAEAEAAVAERTGLSSTTAQLGLELINKLRPGFLERHVHAMLPDMAEAIEPHWNAGLAAGDAPAHLAAHAEAVTSDLLQVSDAYVALARDPKAIAVYNQLRNRADRRIGEQMPRIAGFIERHSSPP